MKGRTEEGRAKAESKQELDTASSKEDVNDRIEAVKAVRVEVHWRFHRSTNSVSVSTGEVSSGDGRRASDWSAEYSLTQSPFPLKDKF